MYALWALSNYKHLDKVDAGYYYIEHNEKHMYTFHQSKREDIRLYFINMINQIEMDTEFKCNPSPLCSHCDYEGIHCKPFKIKL